MSSGDGVERCEWKRRFCLYGRPMPAAADQTKVRVFCISFVAQFWFVLYVVCVLFFMWYVNV